MNNELRAMRRENKALRRCLAEMQQVALDVNAMCERLLLVVEAARGRVIIGHNDTCDHALSEEYECSCGHEALRKAVKATMGIEHDAHEAKEKKPFTCVHGIPVKGGVRCKQCDIITGECKDERHKLRRGNE